MTMFRFGCGHAKYNEEIHDAQWGARLIYSEVTAGGSGVVWDRQTPEGEKELVESLFPVVDRALGEFRKPENQYRLDSGQSGHLVWRDGQRVVVMSPQGSYGYLYITALLEKDGHEGETEIWEFADMPDRVELGNWPPRIVEARAAAESKAQREAILGRVSIAAQDSRWQMHSVFRAKTERSKTMARNKQTKLDDELAEAREAALFAGFTEAEVDKAQRGY